MCVLTASSSSATAGRGRLSTPDPAAGRDDDAAGVPGERAADGAGQLVQERPRNQHRLGQIPRRRRRAV